MLFIFGYSLISLLIAAVAGIMMAVQGSINSSLGKKIGLWETTSIVHTTAAIILIIILLLNHNRFSLQVWRQVPWYLYLGGGLGILITYGVVVSIPKLGVAVATTAIITGQVLTAALIDHLGIFGLEPVPFSWIKFAGIAFLAVGVRLLLN